MIDMKNNAKCDSWMRYVVFALVLMGVNFVAPAQADDTQTITITGHRESKDPPPGPPTAPPRLEPSDHTEPSCWVFPCRKFHTVGRTEQHRAAELQDSDSEAGHTSNQSGRPRSRCVCHR